MSNHENKNSNTWVGIVLVALGGFFLFRNFDWIPYWLPDYLFSWEMILIVVGVAMLITRRREGFIFLAIGGVFILNDIFYLPHFHMGNLWPIVLIIIGISLFMRRREYQNDASNSDDPDFFNETAIFGGSERSFSAKNFKGGKVTSIFGGSDISFINADIQEGGAVIDQFCMFGGNAFSVPNDWTVINESFVIFGGFGDKRRDAERNPDKVLRIKGTVIFGGGEVK